MATITVRGLDDDVQRRLRVRAAENGRSMEAEARAILASAVAERSMIVDWIAAAEEFAVAEEIAVELDVPPRSLARDVDLT